MKALTLWQPWASFIAQGHKQYETRSWSTNHRGELAIHAAKRWKRDQLIDLQTLEHQHPELASNWQQVGLPFGCVVCLTRLVAVHRVENVRDSLTPLERALGGYSNGRFAWELELVEVLEPPVPARGEQGLWHWQTDEQDGMKLVCETRDCGKCIYCRGERNDWNRFPK